MEPETIKQIAFWTWNVIPLIALGCAIFALSIVYKTIKESA